MKPELTALIERMGLEPIPQEGGWFRLGPRVSGLSTITALLADVPEGFSAMHRLTIDEGWQWLDGAPIELVKLHEDGRSEIVVLNAENPQAVVPAGTWQGGRTLGDWSLFACWCSPQFTDGCFELGDRAHLCDAFPNSSEWITQLTRDNSPKDPS